MVVDVRVIDTDSHVTEPADLWTARVPRRFVELVPRVDVNPKSGKSSWRIGDKWLAAPGATAYAGRPDFDSPLVEFSDVDPASWQAPERLKRMDEYGVYAQVLYPNIIGFESRLIIALGEELALLVTQAYNDFVTDFASADRNRLICTTMLPFWDVDASVKEMKRCADRGHKGILFANKYERIGFPRFTDEHWDPIYAAARDLGMSINFHVGFAWSRARELSKERARELAAKEQAEGERRGEFSADMTNALHTQLKQEVASGQVDTSDWSALGRLRGSVSGPVLSQLTNQDTVASFLLSDLPNRFPDLPFVSVESGFGFMPYLLESLDWHWKGSGLDRYTDTLPSEIYRRQCYGTFWFERSTLPMLQYYPDNFMFSTDFPHPTSLSPGPASPAEMPSDHIAHAFADISDEIARKALHDNAARVYNLDA